MAGMTTWFALFYVTPKACFIPVGGALGTANAVVSDHGAFTK